MMVTLNYVVSSLGNGMSGRCSRRFLGDDATQSTPDWLSEPRAVKASGVPAEQIVCYFDTPLSKILGM